MKRNSLLIKICLLIVFASSLQACSQGNNETQYKPSGNGTESNTSTSKATSSAATNESKTKKAEFKWDTDTLNNTSGKTLIKCITTPMPKRNHMSFAIVSSKGTVIIAEPNKLNYTNGVFRADVITSSFINHDHTDSSFIRVNSQARVSVQKAESFTAKDVKVTGVAASQSTAPIDPVSPTEVFEGHFLFSSGKARYQEKPAKMQL
ncbi:Beta-lactamase superfamily domain-containing protein [Fontibacillus panacisegetis]|uniref:Beta-lactamase superfamily domain-containing protein n=1 Tax=Fontibacillus panacisegetis TaxID=670482 RepID=A0A1G7KPI3_9BACL|nr:MBL fold metallo-hydrolase [Fontibacillus panacisegetis]SDF39132.1 Beta-lactamase superfamily domain-containing protein [Fontibacillus panacisegetis]